jgi:hypothetical protein
MCTVLYCTVLYCTVLYCTVLYCTVPLPPGGNPIAVDKYIISYQMFIQDKQWCTYRRYTEAPSGNHCCRGKTIIITYFERVSIASVTQHAMRMRRIILSSVACLAVPYYIVICGLSGCTTLYCHLWPLWLYHILPRYLINGTIFVRKLRNIKHVFWFSL